MFFRKSSPSDLFPQEYASVQGCRSQVKRRGLRGRQGITGPAEPVGPTGATGVPGGHPSSALIFDRNTVDYGAAITHANNSSDFVIQEPGVYLVLFNGTIAPVSNASFPVSTLLYLTQDGTPVVGSGVHYTFQNAEEVANQSFTQPITVTSVPTILQLVSELGTLIYSDVSLTILRLADVP